MKAKVHSFVMKVTFNKPVTAAQAAAEVKDLAALSYETHYTAGFGEVDTRFRMKVGKRVPAKAGAL